MHFVHCETARVKIQQEIINGGPNDIDAKAYSHGIHTDE